MENFVKVTKQLTKLKETLTNYVWDKSLLQKTIRMKLSIDSGFLNVFYMVKNENPETPEIDRKPSKSIKHPVLTVYRY